MLQVTIKDIPSDVVAEMILYIYTGNTPNLSLPDFWYGNYSMAGEPRAGGASGFTDRPFTNAFVEFWCGKWAAFKGVELLQDA